MKHPFRWFAPARSGTSAGHQIEEKAAAPMNSAMFAIAGSGTAIWSNADYATMAKRGYMSNPVVYRCIRHIAQTAAAVPLLAYDGAQELDTHPALDLLRRPNERQGGSDFMEALIGHLLVSGNAYIHGAAIDGAPRELHLLRPDQVVATTGRDGWVTGYEHTSGTARTRYMADEADGWLPVLHIALFHPLEDAQGFAPLQAALTALDVHNAANRWNKALLDNSARPSGALVYSGGHDDNLTDEQFSRLKSELEDGYTGTASAGRPLLLEGGLDWKPMGHSPKDMDFIEARNGAARDIALAFGVPPMLLGIPGDATYANYREANRAFLRHTMVPTLSRILDGLSHWLAPRFEGGLRLAMDEDCIDGLGEDRQAIWDRLKDADYLTDDEKREMLGFSPMSEATK
ncbi:phage portal protein [Ahrensia sp. R2A130]|uniref:phage portal protein n=1 Tax=Ahrensia sp. R2A130 TaxID=744979 RepID=UPI0001E0E8BB|nr:phage portal protein [Ahrensia sp. R2A130]EFL88953.1 phage portal protein, HK97 family [Ahrensia sp. R2A130]